MSEKEFENMIEDLEKAGLIKPRMEAGILYYDSTTKSKEYEKESLYKN